MHQLLKLLAKNFEAAWAVYWRVTEDPQLLRPTFIWNSPQMMSSTLEDDLRKRALSQAEGMPGKAWRTKMAHLSRDISKDMMLPRSIKAVAHGIEFGVWIPIIQRDQVHGVFEILSSKVIDEECGSVELLQGIGEEIGKKLR